MILIMDNAHILNILHAHILKHTFGITHTHTVKERMKDFIHTHFHTHTHIQYIYVCGFTHILIQFARH